MHTFTEVLIALASFYASAHASSRLWVPKLPPPAAVMGNRFYPAIYAFLNWWAAGNGVTPPAEPPKAGG